MSSGDNTNKSTDRRFRAQFHKTELCKFYSNGFCARGHRCHFAHGEKDLKTTPDLNKTSMCRDWTQGGCKLPAEKCPFAHGRDELRRTHLFEKNQTVHSAVRKFGHISSSTPPRQKQWDSRNHSQQGRGTYMTDVATKDQAEKACPIAVTINLNDLVEDASRTVEANSKVQSLITNAHDNGVLKIPPPILSRVYQTISRGFVNLLNAKKITDTKFPFPYAQLISFLLLSHTILTPMMMSVVIRSKILAGIFTFLPIFGMACLNLIAIQLENPFGTDDNDLPLEHFQTEMNSCLLMLLHPNTDMIAGTSPRCIKNFQDLLGSMASHRDGPSAEPVLPAMRLSNFEAQIDDPVSVEKEQTATEDVGESVVIQAPMAHEVPTEATDNKLRELGARRQLSQEPDRQVLEQRADELHVHLMKKMTDFNDHLMRWSQLVENQVIQLTQSFDSLKTFSEQMPFPQAQALSGMPPASGGMPGQKAKTPGTT